MYISESGYLHIGVSKKDNKDKFNKEVALMIAATRAVEESLRNIVSLEKIMASHYLDHENKE